MCDSVIKGHTKCDLENHLDVVKIARCRIPSVFKLKRIHVLTQENNLENHENALYPYTHLRGVKSTSNPMFHAIQYTN